MPRVVWVLGAGFSFSLGAPLLSGLLSPESARRVRHAFGPFGGGLPQLDLAVGVIALYRAGCRGLDHIKGEERHWDHAEEFIETLDLMTEYGTRHGDLAELCEELGKKDPHCPCARFFSKEGPRPKKVRDCAVRMLAAECCEFLELAIPKSERWAPYHDWASKLTDDDTIITFNYDRVPNILAAKPGLTRVPVREDEPPLTYSMWIPSAHEMHEWIKGKNKRTPGPTVLKMHGSVDWLNEDDKFINARQSDSGAYAENHFAQSAAVHCRDGELAIATPGPTKYKMISKDGPLRPIWEYAEDRLKEADAVVFLGYRIPPTDAATRKWFIETLRKNERVKDYERTEWRLDIYTVLGEHTESADSRRLRGLLQGISRNKIAVHRQPMRAEDFLALYSGGLNGFVEG